MLEKAEPRSSDPANEYPKLSLGDLLLFGVYVRNMRTGPVPLSFRRFMDQQTHKVLTRILDALEKRTQTLLVHRVLLRENGTHGDYAQDYYEATAHDSRRVPAVTEHGRLWAEASHIIGQVFDIALDAKDPQLTRERLADLSALAERIKRARPRR